LIAGVFGQQQSQTTKDYVNRGGTWKLSHTSQLPGSQS